MWAIRCVVSSQKRFFTFSATVWWLNRFGSIVISVRWFSSLTTVKEWLTSIRYGYTEEDWSKFCLMTYLIWRNRNNKLYNKGTWSTSTFLRLLNQQVMEMRCLSKMNYFSRDIAKWQPPPVDWIKANTDAAIGTNDWIGIGVVLRDDRGRVVAVLMARYQGLSNAFYGEVLAIKECMRLIQKCNPMKVIIEEGCSRSCPSDHETKSWRIGSCT